MDQGRQNWTAALADLYFVFSKYALPIAMEAAPKHDVAAVMRRLTAAPLNQLSPDQIGAFAGSALYTLGTTADYKHFLPRIVELALGHSPSMGLEADHIARKLVYADWQQWPQNERSAIRRVFHTGWLMTRNACPEECDAVIWLCANATLGIDTAGLLQDWLPLKTSFAALHLASLVVTANSDLDDAPGWDEVAPPAREAIKSWTMRTEVYEALRQAECTLADYDSWHVSQALKHIRRH